MVNNRVLAVSFMSELDYCACMLKRILILSILYLFFMLVDPLYVNSITAILIVAFGFDFLHIYRTTL